MKGHDADLAKLPASQTPNASYKAEAIVPLPRPSAKRSRNSFETAVVALGADALPPIPDTVGDVT